MGSQKEKHMRIIFHRSFSKEENFHFQLYALGPAFDRCISVHTILFYAQLYAHQTFTCRWIESQKQNNNNK